MGVTTKPNFTEPILTVNLKINHIKHEFKSENPLQKDKFVIMVEKQDHIDIHYRCVPMVDINEDIATIIQVYDNEIQRGKPEWKSEYKGKIVDFIRRFHIKGKPLNLLDYSIRCGVYFKERILLTEKLIRIIVVPNKNLI